MHRCVLLHSSLVKCGQGVDECTSSLVQVVRERGTDQQFEGDLGEDDSTSCLVRVAKARDG